VTRWAVAWGPAAAWAAVLFFVSSRNTLPVDLSSGLDKVAHFGAYLVMGFLASFAVAYLRLPVWIAVAAGWAYGIVDELHQSFVPGRYPSVADWIADASGTIAGIVAYLLISRALAAVPTLHLNRTR
jgi:VanZ family protein